MRLLLVANASIVESMIPSAQWAIENELLTPEEALCTLAEAYVDTIRVVEAEDA